MKKFETVEEWLATQPTEEVKESVLYVVNRNLVKNLRKEGWAAARKLKALKRLEIAHKINGVKMSEDLKKEITALEGRIAEIQVLVPKTEGRKKA